MSGGKGGSQSTSVAVPKYVEDAAKANLAKADLLAQIGYTPNYGPDVAAFSRAQEDAFRNTASAADAFGLGGGGTGMEGVPAPTEYAGGIRGYSSAPLYEQSMAELEARRPGQYAAINAPFIDPVTGASPDYPYAGSTGMQGTDLGGIYAADRPYVPNDSSTMDETMAAARASYDASKGTTPATNSGSNAFTRFMTDATDGGGMNKKGGRHKGLGIYSGIANVLGGKY